MLTGCRLTVAHCVWPCACVPLQRRRHNHRQHHQANPRTITLPPHAPPQIDLRFAEREQGSLVVVVAPVARFADIGFNAGERVTG